MAKIVRKDSRHIRHYSDKSDEFDFDSPLARHHLVFVNDAKGIRRNLNQVLENINEVRSGPEVFKRLEGKVKNSDLRYLFVTIKTSANLDVLKLDSLGVLLREDSELYERKHTKIEDYVSRLYSD